MSRQAREKSITLLRAYRKAEILERLVDYCLTEDMALNQVNLSPITRATQWLEEAEQQGRIDKYGNLIA